MDNFAFWRRFLGIDMIRHNELRGELLQVTTKLDDMEQQASHEETQLGNTRKSIFKAFQNQVHRFERSAQAALDGSQEGQWFVTRLLWVPSIERLLKEGQALLTKSNQLIEEGLTNNEIKTRGVIFPLDEDQYMGETVKTVIESIHNAIQNKAQCVGIYGNPGSGKTNVMKQVYNKVFKDEGFKAVYWATAPNLDPDRASYHKAVQECVAAGMWVSLENDDVHDEVRNAGKINERLLDLGSGRAVLFLDNVRAEFPAYELLGIPSLTNPGNTNATNITCSESEPEPEPEPEPVNCVLVFTTQARDICHKMKCDLTHKVDLLNQQEALDMFLHEVGLKNKDRLQLSSRERDIYEIAVEVAKQCARMPLAIKIIARAMNQIDDLRQWRHRLNEMRGKIWKIGKIHNEEDKIAEQLKCGYLCLKDETVRCCFLAAAKMLDEDRQLSKEEIIAKWKTQGLIGTDRQSDYAYDQGLTILNQLERMCLIQFEVVPERDNQVMISMNRWIKKMATKVSQPLQ
ncbi:unnamed protein product [Amaranthus hypochondriacus]